MVSSSRKCPSFLPPEKCETKFGADLWHAEGVTAEKYFSSWMESTTPSRRVVSKSDMEK